MPIPDPEAIRLAELLKLAAEGYTSYWRRLALSKEQRLKRVRIVTHALRSMLDVLNE